ncbi:acetyl-CoA C-acyltransferase [Notoacmeibacter sp. MSK16QG-6]|uniref:acetyl-CoA C-acyltransferase n=1 Tax=Notoacmeibacter sp. MSK16QG-6 TaxID=2957982 RepID=UPI0020A1165E|nr:acetyl-CoA C-acyltransferase [Notoacmeibacter sp. MSK16QG-6]MCP1200273.1 acetyl-CoA C-acyltransferase [Notoacmeibacter sp. MSK16QG-6]
MSSQTIVITGAARTPMGAFQGELSSVSATELGTAAIDAALKKANAFGEAIDEVFMGNVLPAGLGQAPARQAAIHAGIDKATPCTTISKVCGSGMRAVMFAHDALMLGHGKTIVAGGMESMSNAPYLLPKARSGYRIGHGQVLDHMMLDGLEDAYDIAPDGRRRSMGTFGEDCAEKYQLTRDAQDSYAIASVERAAKANKDGGFDWEMTPVTVSSRKGETVIDSDEGPRSIKTEKIPQLRPAFRKDGSITAASSSSINDGAAALVLSTMAQAEKDGAAPVARIVGHSAFAAEPGWFTTAPIFAMDKLLEKIGWSYEDVDLFEINEAFAVVPMVAMQQRSIPHEKVNIHGGACALGHPIGASGARIVVTLLGALKRHGLSKGVASICIGGGEGTAIAVEMIN